MDDQIYDVVVIGAGIEGSATAYNLAKNGFHTLLLEQFTLPHTRGSSHGQSRIIRKAYTEDHFAKMMPEAYERWHTLAKEVKRNIFQQTGLLFYGREGNQEEHKLLTSTEYALKAVNCEFETLNADQMKKRFEGFRFFDDHVGLLDKEAGILRADLALASFQEMFKKFGGKIQDGTQVTEIIPGDRVVLRTKQGHTFKSQKLIITAGAWTPRLIKPLGIHIPLQPVRVSVCYWKQKVDVCSVRSGCPAFINCSSMKASNGQHCMFYGIPAFEYSNLTKVCLHNGIPIDPDFRDATDETWDVEVMCKYVKENFPLLEDKPSVVERCIYTMTPDENFVLDQHPHWRNIVIGAGFSGHGFKLAPVVGKILSDLAIDKAPSHQLSHFSIGRFHSQL